MTRHLDRRPAVGPRATVLRTVGSDIALLCREVESIRTDEGVPRDVRDRLALIDDELARIARLTDAEEHPTADDAESTHRLARHLTEREWQCLELLATGLNTQAMARALTVSVTTVRTHVQSVLAKLGVNSRLQAVALTVRTGLLDQRVSTATWLRGSAGGFPDAVAGAGS